MIFYFSGTGNSLWVARRLSEKLEDSSLLSVADELKRAGRGGVCEYGLGKNEPVVLVFPVHAWGPAVMMLRFVSSLSLKNYAGQPIYAVCVCGDNCGLSYQILGSALSRKNLRLTACWSVQMPNNYILMKGFGVDRPEVRDAKLAAAPSQTDRIAAAIRSGRPGSYVHYVAGTHLKLKSRVVNPLFRRFLAGPDSRTKFHVSDACIGCGLCAKVCPTGTVAMHDGRPVWGRGCVQCTACINRCPVRAIDYGSVSQSQGRYHHPELN